MSNQPQTNYTTSSSSTFSALGDPMSSLLRDLSLEPAPSKTSDDNTHRTSLATIEEEGRADESDSQMSQGQYDRHAHRGGPAEQGRHEAQEEEGEWEYIRNGLNIAHTIGVL